MSRTMCPSCRSIIARAWATGVGVAVRQPHHLEAVAERGQRVPQLVGQQGEELVLAPVLLAQLAVEPGVLDRDGGDVCQLDEDRLVALREVAVVLVGDAGSAQVLPAAADRAGRPSSPAAAGSRLLSRLTFLPRRVGLAARPA